MNRPGMNVVGALAAAVVLGLPPVLAASSAPRGACNLASDEADPLCHVADGLAADATGDSASLLQLSERRERVNIAAASAKQSGTSSNGWAGKAFGFPVATTDQLKNAAQGATDKERGGLSAGKTVDLGSCVMQKCMDFTDPNRDFHCEECLWSWARGWPVMDTPVGVNDVAIGYVVDMLSIAVKGGTYGVNTYSEVWCGGDQANCHQKLNFPGPNTSSYIDRQTVWDMGSQYPKKLWSGEWWRGAELGLLIQAPYFWSAESTRTDPIGMSLGMTSRQHVAVRPVMDKMFKLGGRFSPRRHEVQSILKDMIPRFLEERKQNGIKIPEDLKAFQFQVLNKVALDRDVSWADAHEFVGVQSLMVAMGSVGQLLPEVLYPFLASIRDKYSSLVQDVMVFVEEKFGDELARKDCAPTTNCLVQASVATMDAFTLAGGLSVPSGIATGLAVLYSKHEGNPMEGPEREIPKGKEVNFFWESLRFFAPVVGFPHWKKRPTCAGMTSKQTGSLNRPRGATKACPMDSNDWWTGYPKMNQYQGGVHEAPNLALAQRDPKAWGANADKFVIRSLEAYKKSVGFAEMAKDRSVAGGKNDRDCPGKDLALMIGSLFFENFDVQEWTAKKPGEIQFVSGPKYITDFVLKNSAKATSN